MIRRGWYSLGILVGMIVLLIAARPHGELQLIACDVGQGDAILITKGETQVLVDGGPSGEKLLDCLAEHTPFYDRQIELIVLTNTDVDHLSGLRSVLDRYCVMCFVTAGGVHASAQLDLFIAQLAASSLTVESVSAGDTIRILGPAPLTFRVLSPPMTNREYVAVFQPNLGSDVREQLLAASAKRGNLNERSVVLLLLEDTYTALLMGDAGDQTEKRLVASKELSTVDYLKVGHHGSKYASTQDFLDMIRPKTAVISVGQGNRYGHPTDETLARLKAVGAMVRRTDVEGTVVVTPTHDE
jgi:competence protein ComEC